MKIKILNVAFENKINQQEVDYFRGAIIATAGKEHTLFHNHINDGFRYKYPLIQYKRIGKKPHLICINEGVESIHHFFSNKQEGIMLGKRPYELKVDEINLSNHELTVSNTSLKYKLTNWLPLNQKNIKEYNKLESEIDRYEFLEKILIGNILSMAKGLNWFITDKINIRITSIKGKQVQKKGNKLLNLDVTFITNVNLPNHIGLGKNASNGFGVLNNVVGK